MGVMCNMKAMFDKHVYIFVVKFETRIFSGPSPLRIKTTSSHRRY
jgi:hypothetical protein